jgi:hypothetical protein
MPWRRFQGFELIPKVGGGVQFVDGEEQTQLDLYYAKKGGIGYGYRNDYPIACPGQPRKVGTHDVD